MVSELGISVDIGGVGYMKNPPVFAELAITAPTHPFVFVDIQDTVPVFPPNTSVIKPATKHWEGFLKRFLAEYRIPLADASANDVRMDFVMDFLRGKQVPALLREVERILKPGASFYLVDFTPNCAHARRAAPLCGLVPVARLNQEALLKSGYPLSPNTERFIEFNLDNIIPLTTEFNVFMKQ